MKYIEFGIGNRWLVRTETELADGTEIEEEGIVRPVRFHSLYIRIWIHQTVWVLDMREGFKRARKNRIAFKLIVGITSH
ncbi:DUF3977 family protein [Paenibacillus sacheonensis]|uniref:DUF3977 family protein n=1 Tax=Paenibacillus sacheonensis TaxID=742054 RepID=A0A7X4YTX5_9BACL|nr:DUF3977 family protein [Paenibacillus sacheonensis]NBC72530.1 DUF3977 family protein [Paenibacillus sacheonensis]